MEFRNFVDLLWSMTEKELRARYKNTLFGFLWLLLNPILQMLVIGFIFTFFLKQPVEHYYYHLFIGLLIWNFFSLSLTRATSSIVQERALIKKSRFPQAVIPLSIIASNFTHFILALVLFWIAALFLGTFSVTRLPQVALGLFQLISFTVGASLLTAALNVRFRDIAFFVQALLIIWFYATPIIYALTMVPRSIFWLWRFNPLTSTLQLFQSAFLAEAAPGPLMILSNLTVILAVTTLGLVIFQKESRNFDDWL